MGFVGFIVKRCSKPGFPEGNDELKTAREAEIEVGGPGDVSQNGRQ